MVKTKQNLAGFIEEAAADMHRLMAAAPGSGTQEAQLAASRLFEGAMATSKRFAEALLDRAEPSPVVELQRRFVGEYFDALARGGTLVYRAATEAAQQSSEPHARERDHHKDVGDAAPTGTSHTRQTMD
jgi:hypothetical protein